MSWFDEKAPKGARLVCLDPYGKDTSSEGLAKLLVRWHDNSIPATYFAIGGADGHHPDLLARADPKLAFGSATWPHMLFRAMLSACRVSVREMQDGLGQGLGPTGTP